MKKINLLAVLFVLIGCSSGNRDAQIMDEYLSNEYNKTISMNTFVYSHIGSEAYSEFDIRGLKNIITTTFSFSSPTGELSVTTETGKSSGYKFYRVRPNLEALGKSSVDLPLNVNCYCDCGLNNTYTLTLHYGPYTSYLAYIYQLNRHVSDSSVNNNVFSYKSVRNGHFYYEHKYTFSHANTSLTYYVYSYEKDANLGIYNKQTYEATYYYDSNPRIEGLTTGTYYVTGTIEADNTDDSQIISAAKQLNEIFKSYSDFDYVTAIS